jgi:YebC/PmpR family DNA-binding regulatory protein
MSGHSKWANIKNRKGAQDKKRSVAFTLASKNIMTALRTGTGLPNAIEKAKEVNMPKENVDRLLARFEERKNNLVAGMFEGYGPAGVPIMVETETDNKNRTLGEIKLIFKINDGNLGESGSVGYMFDRVGEVETTGFTDDQELELIDAGASDFDDKTVITGVVDLHKVVEKIKEMGIGVESSGLVMRCKSPVELMSEDDVAKVMELVESLEENDDVINVFAGFDYHE